MLFAGAVIASPFIANLLLEKNEGELNQEQPLYEPVQITKAVFGYNGDNVVLRIENQGNRSFSFKGISVSGGLFPMSHRKDEIFNVDPLEKLNLSLEHYWKPDSDYEFIIKVLFEGEEKYMDVSYQIRSPSTYPYIYKITNATFRGTKIYDDLGALVDIQGQAVTLTVSNLHQSTILTITKLYLETHHSTSLSKRLGAKSTITFTVNFDWAEGESYSFLLVATRDFKTAPNEVFYSNNYQCQA